MLTRPRAGQVVRFTDRDAGQVEGLVYRVGKKVATIVTRHGVEWKVPFTMLEVV